MKRLALLFFLLATAAYGQGVRFSSTVTQQGTIGTATNAVVLPAGATIAFCNHPANTVPCTNKATTYSDQTLAVACNTSTQLVLDGTTTCVALPDAQNNWGVWVAPNTAGYDYTITLPGGVNRGPFNVLSTTTLGICPVTSTLAAAVTCAGTSGTVQVSPAVVVPALTAAVTIPAGVTFRFDGGSTPIPLGNFNLTVQGQIQAPGVQLVSYTGSGVLVISNQKTINAAWFPGSDQGVQIANSIASINVAGGRISVCDLPTSMTNAATLHIDGSGGTGGIPIELVFCGNQKLTGGAAANPVVCVGNVSTLTGTYQDSVNTSSPAIQTNTAANTVMKACNPSTQTTNYVKMSGMVLFNLSGSATAPVLDYSNISNSTWRLSSIEHGGGTGDLIFCKSTGGFVSFYNTFDKDEYQMNDNLGNIFDLQDLCNDVQFDHGVTHNGLGVFVINGSSVPNSPNDIQINLSLEQFKGPAFTIGPNAYNVSTAPSMRIESTVAGASIFSNSNAGSVIKGIWLANPDYQGNGTVPTYGTDAGAVTICPYNQGGLLSPSASHALFGCMVPNSSVYAWENFAGTDFVGMSVNSSNNWTWPNNVLPKRYDSTGSALVSGDVTTISGAFGTGASVAGISGTDTSFTVRITAGTTPGTNPFINVTFHDGTWTTGPGCTVSRFDTNMPTAAIWSASTSATILTLTFIGNPVASSTYGVTVHCIGQNRS